MTRKLAIAMGLCSALPQLAQAQLSDLICDDTSRLQQQLETVVGAKQQARGMRDPESLIEVWIVPGSGDWTIVQNYANGTSCILAIGEFWEAVEAEPT